MKHKLEHKKMPPVRADSTALQTVIASQPFFRGFSAEHLDFLASCAMQTEFHDNEVIFQQGDVANRLYLIEDGKIALETERAECGAILIQTLGAGDALGWSWLFPPCVWRFSARAVAPTRAIFFYGTWLRERCEQDTNFGCKLMERTVQVAIDRLQATRQQLVEISQVALKAQAEALRLAIQQQKHIPHVPQAIA